MKKMFAYVPAVVTVVVGLIVWREVSGVYAKARARVLSAIPKSEK